MYEAIGYRHAAATAHPLATEAAISAMRRGGSAVDAAIAANAVLGVTEPDSCGLGGDLFALVYCAAEQKVQAYVAAGPVGSAFDRKKLPRNGSMPERGPLAVTLPGAVAGWDLLYRSHGKLPWPDLLQGAAKIATRGYPLTRKVAQTLAEAEDFGDEAFLLQFLPHGAPRAGDLQRSPNLAKTLQALAHEGPDWFYHGPFAAALEQTLLPGGGSVTREDMAAFRAERVRPLVASYRGRQIFVTPPPSQGVTLLLALAILDGLPAGASADDAAALHLLVEAKRRAYLLRDDLLADPRTAPVDWQAILQGPFAAAARTDIDPTSSRLPSPRLRPGGTTFLCTWDAAGDACALIQSNYLGVGSGVLVPGFGVHLQNRGSYFSLEDGHPNAIAAGKRTVHTLMASMVFGEGGLETVLGAMGGDGQPQTNLQILRRLIDYGEGLEEAVAAPRLRDGVGDPPALQLEAGLGDLAPALAAFGHTVRVGAARMHGMGHAQAITRGPSGLLRATADPRGDGIAWAE
ncbi:MAG: gamma-glutamyltransferase family protein [Thermaerobacter sp.]|nr:gamma-glutamyltransferase family protein [Thermaerobacter sp.]